MLVELRSSDRLRGPKAMDIGPVLTSVLEAARDGTADLSRLRVVCDWIQYKRNFREPIARREILPSSFLSAQARRNGDWQNPHASPPFACACPPHLGAALPAL